MEWGINLSRRKKLLPQGLIWRLSLLNVVVIAATIAISGIAIYNAACFLADGIGNLDVLRQQRFNRKLLEYLLVFSIVGLVIGGILQYVFTSKLIKPIKRLTDAAKHLQQGEFPEEIETTAQDEVGQLVAQFNQLITQLQTNERERVKLISDLSHEVRTPLSNLNGYLQALKSGDLTGDVAMYEALYQESKRLTELIEQLEQLKEWDSLTVNQYTTREVTEMSNLVEQCVQMFHWKLDKERIDIATNVEQANLWLYPSGIQQVITNLIDNAIMYYEGTAPIEIVGMREEDTYKLMICGESAYIEESERERIFERFYRIDASRSRANGGSGLGLAIAKEIVTHHGGEIWVDVYETRQCFSLTLPIHEIKNH